MPIEATSTVARSPDLDLAITAWLNRYPNPNTAANYELTIRQWTAWCAARGVDPLAVKRLHVEAWASDLRLGGAAESTVHHKLTRLSSFYRFADEDDLLAGKNPMPHVRSPKVPRRSTTNGLTRTQLNDVLAAAQEDRPTVFALVCILGLNGCRVSEACGITRADVAMTGWHRTITVTRKGGKRQHLPLAPITAHAVDRALEESKGDHLLVARSDATVGLSRSSALKIVQRLARQVGVPQKVSPHSLRHSFCTLSLDAGVATRDIQASAGWASEAMVAYYDRAREHLDRNATFTLTSHVLGAA